MESLAQNVVSNEELPAADGWFELDVPADGSVALLKKIIRHIDDGQPVKTADILEKLKELNVTYGIELDVIDALLKSVDENDLPDEPVVIAKADVEHGEAGTVEWRIGDMTENNAGFLVVPHIELAIWTPPTKGKVGKNVFGEAMQPLPGEEKSLNVGKGIVCSEATDGMLIYESTQVGMLRYEAGTLFVDSGFVVSEDKLQAHMDIYAGKVSGQKRDISDKDIQEMLDIAGIQYGIKPENITSALEEAEQSGEGVKDVLVAEGDAPVDGIEWRLDVKSKISLDRKEIYKRAVLPNQTIAAIKEKQELKSGKDIFNEVIPVADNPEALIECGDGVEKREFEGYCEYRALKLGVVQYRAGVLAVKSGIKVSPDKMQVTMSLLRPDIASDEGDISFDHVLTTLNESGIVYGIKNDAIKLILDNINKERKSKLDLLLAEGVPAKDAVDTRIEFNEELFTDGKILPNGKINAYEKSYPFAIKSGDVIGKVVPAIRAEKGRDVLGELLEAKDIEASKPKLAGIKKNRDGSLRATKSGILLGSELDYKVEACLEHEGNLTEETGNINSSKSVNVSGGIEPGITLETKGDAIIKKNVDNATVSAEGDVVIKSGVRGSYSKISAGKNLTTSFAENAHLNVKGNAVIRNSLTNCQTACDGVVHVSNAQSGEGTILGDITHAYKGIEVDVLGSEDCNETVVEVGVGSVAYMRLQAMPTETRALEKSIAELKKGYEHFRRNPKPKKEQDVVLSKLTTALEQKNKEYAALLKEKDTTQNLLEGSRDVKVIVNERVYPGVVIHILDQAFKVEEEMGAGMFFIKEGEITFEPKISDTDCE